MILHRKDIEKIVNVLNKFPDVNTFELEQETGSGIGSITFITFPHEINGIRGSYGVEISGVEDW